MYLKYIQVKVFGFLLFDRQKVKKIERKYDASSFQCNTEKNSLLPFIEKNRNNNSTYFIYQKT